MTDVDLGVTTGSRKLRVLDFDTECRPLAWYGGDFVTKQPTAISWKFVGTARKPTVAVIGQSFDSRQVLDEESRMLKQFLEAYLQADVVTGHFILGFDLPLINGSMIRLGLGQLPDKLVQDTKIHMAKAQGISKSQENLGAMFELDHPKVPMNCYTPETRFLTSDLRWVACGDLQQGDHVWSFTEDRKWTDTRVTLSEPGVKEAVEVYLDTGEILTCTTDHRWLAHAEGDRHFVWTKPSDLLNRPVLHRPFIPYEQDTSSEAGWLAGMLDGEGTVGKSTRVGVVQSLGETADRLASVASRYGNWGSRLETPTHSLPGKRGPYKTQNRMYLNGGVTANVEMLTRVRPERLIKAFDMTGTQLRTAYDVRVVGIRKVGPREIQSISTESGTYIAEGFAVHNTDKWGRANMLLPDGINETIKRVVGDVEQHIELRQKMIDLGVLGAPIRWSAAASGRSAKYQA